jgi:thiol-disulfide isomerase/thioredoxin
MTGKPMRIIPLLLILPGTLSLAIASEIPTETLWTSLAAKRSTLSSAHQEFEVSQSTRFANGGSRASKRQSILDLAPGQWRETSVSGSGSHIRIYDGNEILSMEEGGDEYVRIRRRPNATTEPVPNTYRLALPDWPRAKELERAACNLPGVSHQCVIFEIPLKPAVPRNLTQDTTRMLNGVTRVALDLETGLLVSSRTLENYQNRNGGYQTTLHYVLKKMSYGGGPADAALFAVPSAEMAEVKELTKWNAAKIRKRLAGQAAPELSVTDINGNLISLADLKGKTVLLDFWTTWCPPCRADAPSLDKLYKKYSGKNFTIVSISVSEDRAVVEKFLNGHPHSYPIALTTENEIPRPYQIGTFPTYIIVDPDGTVASAVEGNQGFGELRKLLKKAGLELE